MQDNHPPTQPGHRVLLALKGAAMGIAETIPGVSGGTIAFITGIYERLINSISAFRPGLIGLARRKGATAVWAAVDGAFLVNLMVGMVAGMLLGLVVVAFLLEHYPPVVWAFFFGLIIASILYIARQIRQWDLTRVAALVAGGVIAYGITRLPLGQADESLWFVFLCGAVAVSALMLPGISGSFILLLLGMYQYILHETVKDGVLVRQDPAAILTMLVFGFGLLTGLATFSRVVSWAFRRYHMGTLSVMTGFMIGAMPALWPWRLPVTVMTEDGQVLPFQAGVVADKILKEVNVLPGRYAAELGEPAMVAATIISMVLGFVMVYYLETKSKVQF